MWKHASLNRRYRLVWNRVRQCWSVAPEIACGQGKAAAGASEPVQAACILPLRALVVAIGCAFSLPALALDAGALPTGGNVVAGQASLSQSGNTLTVNQGSDRAILEWQSFNIGKDAAVHFNQNSASSVALNRVTGGTRSEIYGSLTANGQVYLVNSAGVLFGNTAQVDVGGIVASTLDITNDDFLAGKNRFVQGSGTGEVINQGSITARDGGTVALIGSSVSNTGQIVAAGGNVALAAGQQVTFAAGANGHLQIAVDATEAQALVHNGGLIKADGGQVILTAQGANALASAVVSNTGTIQARTVAEREGKILLLADFDSGTTQVAGTLDASALDGGNGGFIETSAAHVKVADSAKVTTKAASGQTGTWLIDPSDFTVSAGSAAQTTSGIGADTLNANLQNTSVTLQTVATGSEDGDININAAVNWSADTTLTLDAHGDININAAITATGTNAGLELNYGGHTQNGSVASGSDYNVKAPITLSGSGSTLSINGNAYTLIRSMAQLDALDAAGTGVSGFYALAQDLDASGTTYTQALVGTSNTNIFNGAFAGLGHTISNLTISADSTNYIGLFGYTGSGSVIRDIGLVGGSISASGGVYIGSLAGYNGGSIRNAYATSSVSGAGSTYIGGLVGRNAGSVSNAYAAGNVAGYERTNGNTTYSSLYVGGLVGSNVGSISNAYASGRILNGLYAGGLVGQNTGQISNAYATGSVPGQSNGAGGLVGSGNGSITNSFYATTDANGNVINNGGVTNFLFSGNSLGSGKTRAELSQLSTFTGWDIDDAGGTGSIWRIYEGYTTPLLRSFLRQVTATVTAPADRTYDGTTQTITGTGYQLSDVSAALLGSATYNSVQARNAGTYALGLSGLYSNQSGYDLTVIEGQYTIVKADLTLNGITASNKTYDGTTSASITGNASVSPFGTDVVFVSGTGVGNFVDQNAGTGKTVILSGYTLSGADADNYTLAQPNGLTADIDKAVLIVSTGNVSKTYDGTATAAGAAIVTGGTLFGSDSLSGGTFAYTDTNAGSSKTVTTSGVTISDGNNGDNYAVTYADNTDSTITAKAITVTATSGSSTYGDTGSVNPGLTASGLVNGESVSVLTGLSNSFGIDNTTHAGSHTLTVNGTLSNGNYVVTQRNDGTWVVDPKAITVTAASGSSTYGDTGSVNPGLIASGLVNGEDASVLTGLSNSFGIDNTSNAGSHVLTVSGTLSNGNYVVTQRNDGTWVVDPKAISVTAQGGRSTYGDSTSLNPGFIASGLANGENESVLTGLSNSFGIDNTTNAGSHVLTVNGTLSNGNYVVTQTTNGTWVVDPKAITVTATSGSSTYGDTGSINPGLTASGLVNGESASVLTGLSNSFGIDNTSNAGSHVLTVSGTLSNGNYIVTQTIDGAWVVDPKAISVTAIGGRSTYGDSASSNPGFTASGLVNGQDESVLTGLANSFGIDNTSNAGSHVLTVSGTLSNGNYVVTHTSNGTWVVDPKAITVTATSGSSTYGSTGSSNPGLTVAGLANGESAAVLTGLSNSFALDNSTTIGSYVLTVTGTLSNGNYLVTQTANGTWEVNRKVLTVQANSDRRTVSPGEVYSGGNGVTYSGFVNGEDSSVLLGSLAYGGTAQGASRAGTYSLSVSGLSADNYAIQYVDGRLLLTAPLTTPGGGDLARPVRDSLRNLPSGLPLALASTQPLYLTIMNDPIGMAD